MKTKQTEVLLKKHPVEQQNVLLKSVPFIPQEKNQCGPATMAMAMNYWGNPVDVDKLLPEMYTGTLEGTFQSEMISTPRNYGFMSIPLSKLTDLVREVEKGHPVIIFQNLGLSFFPKWHYALVVGYDLNGPDLILHTGPDKFKRMDMRLVERNWKLAENWALLILPPDKLSITQSEKAHIESASSLERLGKTEAAEMAYRAIISKWPRSFLSYVGLGNTHYVRNDFKRSVEFLAKARDLNPDSPEVWHNLATAQGALGLKDEAKKSSHKAMELVEESERDIYLAGLKKWL